MIRIIKEPCRFVVLLFLVLAAGPACTSRERPPAARTDAPEDLAAEELRLRGALARTPRDPELTFSLARVLAEQEKVRESVDLFTETVLLDPGMSKPVNRERHHHLEEYLEEAEDLLEDGRSEEAMETLDRAEIMIPGDGRTAYLQGRILLDSGEPEAALPSLRGAVASEEGNREYRESLAACLLKLGQGEYEEGRFEPAYELLEEAESLHSGPDLLYLRGMVAYAWARNSADEEKRERLEVAADCFRRVLEKDPRDGDARFNLGAVLLASERYEEAAAVYGDLIRENPEDGRLFSALSRAHSLSGMNEVAQTEDAIGRALRTGEHVDNPEMWSYRAAERFPETSLARTYAEHGNPEEVVTYTVPGGGLVEVWFYWDQGRIQAFREGGEIGFPFFLER